MENINIEIIRKEFPEHEKWIKTKSKRETIKDFLRYVHKKYGIELLEEVDGKHVFADESALIDEFLNIDWNKMNEESKILGQYISVE